MSVQFKPDFERYLTALNCQEPDRVPLGDFHVDVRPKAAFLGRKLKTIEDEVAFWHSAGFDYVTASSGILEPVRALAGTSIKGEAVRTEYGERAEREWAQEDEGVITDWESFERFSWPKVDDFDLSKWDALDKILPPGMKAILILGKIYTPVWMYMGAKVFFHALENNEELVGALFDKVGQIQYETFLRVIEHPCLGAVLNPDDIAHNLGLLIHPRHLRQHVFPWYKKMGQICRQKGLGFVFHSDGDCTEVMEDLIAAGFHGFNPVQPNAMDIVAVKKRWGERLCLLGNLNLDSTLTLGSPEDVRAEVYERIREIGPGGGYMVASSNSITDYVPLANMKAMFEATFEFGRYPLNLEAGAIKGRVWTYQARKEAPEKVPPTPGLAIEPFVQALLGPTTVLFDLIEKSLATGLGGSEVVSKGLIPAMAVIGQKFQRSEIYIPEMMIAAEAMAGALEKFQAQIAGQSLEEIGRVVIGTVRGDMHDIGKNLVALTLRGQGFAVTDLGVSVSPEGLVAAVGQSRPHILALSALLTTTMTEMKTAIEALKAAGIRREVKVIIGGAPVTQAFADEIGADGYAYDAPAAAQKCRQLLAG